MLLLELKMTISEKLNEVFATAPNGFVPINYLTSLTRNQKLIHDIADKYSFKPMYKPRSKHIIGYGNLLYSKHWVMNTYLDQGRYK